MVRAAWGQYRCWCGRIANESGRPLRLRGGPVPAIGPVECLVMARQLDNPGKRIRLFLVDDEPLVRRGLRMLFNVQPDLEVCGEAETEAEALKGILARQPHLAVVDLTLKDGDGLALIRQLHLRCPALKILVFSMHAQVQFATAACAAGAHGYVVKEEGTEQVLEAIHVLMDGGCYLSEQMAAKAPGLLPRTKPRGKTGVP